MPNLQSLVFFWLSKNVQRQLVNFVQSNSFALPNRQNCKELEYPSNKCLMLKLVKLL